MENVLGKILQEELKKEGAMSKVDFASMLSISYRTLTNVINGKAHLTLEQIIKASEILQVDLVKRTLYATHHEHILAMEPEAPYLRKGDKKSPTMTISISVSGFFDDVTQSFPDFLKSVKNQADLYGFRLE